MEEFDLKAAKAGKKVMTRDGRNVRIVCFDCKDPVKPIVALVEKTVVYEFPERHEKIEEDIVKYSPQGKAGDMHNDLVMASEKYVGWVNIYYDNATAKAEMYHEIYATEEIARHQGQFYDWIATVKVEWEE